MAPRGTPKGKLRKPRSLMSKTIKDASYNPQNVRSVSTHVGEPSSVRPKVRSPTPDELHQSGPPDDMDPAHSEMTQDQSVKRKRSTALERVASSVNDATAIQHDKSESDDGTTDYALPSKRARTGPNSEALNKLKKYHGEAAVAAQMKHDFQAQAARMVQKTLEDHDERIDEAEKGRAELNERHDILKQAQELCDADNKRLKENFADVLEATIVSNANLEEDRKRHDSHKARADADRIVVSTLATRVEKDEDYIAAQLKSRPKLEDVTALIADENKLREEAMKQLGQKQSAACAESLRQGLESFQQTSLKTIIADKLEPIVARVEKKLTASAGRDSRMKSQIKSTDNNIAEIAVAVSTIDLQLKQTATTEDVEMLLASERKEREEALSQLNINCTANISTQLSAGIETLESRLEDVTIPDALLPLRKELIALKEQQKDDYKTMATEMQQKPQADYDRMAKETSGKLAVVNERMAEMTGLLDRKVNTLQQELIAERQRLVVERQDWVKQWDLFRAENKQLRMETKANHDESEKKLEAMEMARAAEKAAHAAQMAADADQMAMMADGLAQLRLELHAERAKVAAAHAALRADDLERLKKLEDSADTARVRVDSLHDTVEAQDLHEARNRSSQLETTVSQSTKLRKDLDSLKTTVESMVAVVKASEGRRVTAQKRADDYEAVTQSISTDFDLLKHKLEDHVNDLTTKAQDQAEAMKSHANQVERQLRNRIDDQLDLRLELSNYHCQENRPKLLAVQKRMRSFLGVKTQNMVSQTSGIAQFSNDSAREVPDDQSTIHETYSPADLLQDVATLQTRLIPWMNRQFLEIQGYQKCFLEMKDQQKCVVEEVADVSAKCTNLEAQVRILRDNMRS